MAQGLHRISLPNWANHPVLRVLGLVFLFKDLVGVVLAAGAVVGGIVAAQGVWSVVSVALGVLALLVVVASPIVRRISAPESSSQTSLAPSSVLTTQLTAVRSDMLDLEHYLAGRSIGDAVEDLAGLFTEGKRLKRRIELSAINIPRAKIAGTSATDQVVRERATRDWDADVRAAVAPFGNHYLDWWESVDGLPDGNPAVALIEPTTDIQGLRLFFDAKLARLREIMEAIGDGQVGRC